MGSLIWGPSRTCIQVQTSVRAIKAKLESVRIVSSCSLCNKIHILCIVLLNTRILQSRSVSFTFCSMR